RQARRRPPCEGRQPPRKRGSYPAPPPPAGRGAGSSRYGWGRMRSPPPPPRLVLGSSGTTDAHDGSTIPTSSSSPDGSASRRSVSGPHRSVWTILVAPSAWIHSACCVYAVTSWTSRMSCEPARPAPRTSRRSGAHAATRATIESGGNDVGGTRPRPRPRLPPQPNEEHRPDRRERARGDQEAARGAGRSVPR